jgi:hypothetical protein
MLLKMLQYTIVEIKGAAQPISAIPSATKPPQKSGDFEFSGMYNQAVKTKPTIAGQGEA